MVTVMAKSENLRNHDEASEILHNKSNTSSSVNSENYELSNQSDKSLKLGNNEPVQNQNYDSGHQRQMYQNTQRSYNEQREQYTEQAFNDYTAPANTVERQLQPVVTEQHYDYEKASAQDSDSNIGSEFQRYHYGSNTGTHVAETVGNIALPALEKRLEKGLSSVDYQLDIDNGQIPLGSAENAEMFKNSYEIHKGRIKKDKLYVKLKTTQKKRIKASYESAKRLKEDNISNSENIKNDSISYKKNEKKLIKLNQESAKRLKEDNINDNEKLKDDNAVLKNEKAIRTVRIKHDAKKRLYDRHDVYDKDGASDLAKAVDEVLRKDNKWYRFKKNKRDERFQSYRTTAVYVGRLKFEKTKSKQKFTKKDYEEKLEKKEKRATSQRIQSRLIASNIKSLASDENIRDDELASDVKRTLKRGYNYATYATRRNIKNLRSMHNPYARLQQLNQREEYLLNQRKRLLSKDERRMEREKLRQAETRKQRKKLKKEMARVRAQKEGSFFRRVKNQFVIKKKSQAYKIRVVKRTLSTIVSVCGIIFVVLFGSLLGLMLILALVHGSASVYSNTVVQVDYSDMSDATAYYQKLETDLDEFFNDETKLEELEEDLQTEYGPDIYEFNYILPEYGFSNNTLIAYLAAKYKNFVLDDIKTDLDSVFAEMYTLSYETKMEYRDIPDESVTDPETGEHPTVSVLKKICYIKLEKKELEEVVEARLTEEELTLYKSYKLSSGGQQIYGPVMEADWTNKISSNYGERIHPITKERTFHKGVDIAIPTGTKLYSAVNGTVILAQYSETAGYYVKIQNSTGWIVTFMHMDSYVVSVGQEIKKGDFVGYSGNTGRSTGPHLHLQVEDASGNTINPVFIVPQNCHVID